MYSMKVGCARCPSRQQQKRCSFYLKYIPQTLSIGNWGEMGIDAQYKIKYGQTMGKHLIEDCQVSFLLFSIF